MIYFVMAAVVLLRPKALRPDANEVGASLLLAVAAVLLFPRVRRKTLSVRRNPDRDLRESLDLLLVYAHGLVRHSAFSASAATCGSGGPPGDRMAHGSLPVAAAALAALVIVYFSSR